MVRCSFNLNILLTPYGVCCVLFGAIHPHQNPNISSPPKGMGGIVRENEPASATESKKCYTGRNNLELLERKSGGRRAGEEEPAQRNTWQKFPAWARRPPLLRYAPRRVEAVNRCSVFTNRACAATWRCTAYILRRRGSTPTSTAAAASFRPTGDFA